MKFRRLEERSAEMPHPEAKKPWYMAGKKIPTVYHGGPITVRKIDPSKAGDNEGSASGDYGPGFYTTTDVQSARTYKDTSIDSKNVKYRRKPDPRKKRTNRYSPILNKDGEPHTMLSTFKVHPSTHILHADKWVKANGGHQAGLNLDSTSPTIRKDTVQKVYDHASANGYDAIYANPSQESDQMVWLKPTHKLVPVPHRVARRQGLKGKDESLNLRFKPLEEDTQPHPDADKPWYIPGHKLPTEYHGGPVTVRKVNLRHAGENEGEPDGDLGKGFYTTSDAESARGYMKAAGMHNATVRHIKGERWGEFADEPEGVPHTMLSVFKVHPSAHILDYQKYTEHVDRNKSVDQIFKRDNKKHIKSVYNYAKKNGYDAIHANTWTGKQTLWLHDKTPKLVPVPHRVARRQGLKAKDESLNLRFKPLHENVNTAFNQDKYKASTKKAAHWDAGAGGAGWCTNHKHTETDPAPHMVTDVSDHNGVYAGHMVTCHASKTAEVHVPMQHLSIDSSSQFAELAQQAAKLPRDYSVTVKGHRSHLFKDIKGAEYAADVQTPAMVEPAPTYKMSAGHIADHVNTAAFRVGTRRASYKKLPPERLRPRAQVKQPAKVQTHDTSKESEWQMSGDAYNRHHGSLVHGGDKKITGIDPRVLQKRDSGWYGKGFYTTINSTSGKTYAKSYGKKLTHKRFTPDAKIIMAHTHPAGTHPDLVKAVAKHNIETSMGMPKDTSMHSHVIDAEVQHLHANAFGQSRWTNSVNKFAEDHGYSAVHWNRQLLPHDMVGGNSTSDYSRDPEVVVKRLGHTVNHTTFTKEKPFRPKAQPSKEHPDEGSSWHGKGSQNRSKIYGLKMPPEEANQSKSPKHLLFYDHPHSPDEGGSRPTPRGDVKMHTKNPHVDTLDRTGDVGGVFQFNHGAHILNVHRDFKKNDHALVSKVLGSRYLADKAHEGHEGLRSMFFKNAHKYGKENGYHATVIHGEEGSDRDEVTVHHPSAVRGIGWHKHGDPADVHSMVEEFDEDYEILMETSIRFKPLTEAPVTVRKSVMDIHGDCTHTTHYIRHGHAFAEVDHEPCTKTLYVHYLTAHDSILVGDSSVSNWNPKAAEINHPDNNRSAALVGRHILKMAKDTGCEIHANAAHDVTRKALHKYKFHGLKHT